MKCKYLVTPNRSEDQCIPCPKGYSCPIGTIVPILGNGIKTGDLVAAIVVPILLLIIVLIIFFCCYKKWQKDKNPKKEIYAERPEIGFPLGRAVPPPKAPRTGMIFGPVSVF